MPFILNRFITAKEGTVAPLSVFVNTVLSRESEHGGTRDSAPAEAGGSGVTFKLCTVFSVNMRKGSIHDRFFVCLLLFTKGRFLRLRNGIFVRHLCLRENSYCLAQSSVSQHESHQKKLLLRNSGIYKCVLHRYSRLNTIFEFSKIVNCLLYWMIFILCG